MLRAEDYYDILAANERILDENRRAQRLASEPPRNVQLQERYLQQAVNLGLIPLKFSPSPVSILRCNAAAATSGAATNSSSPPRSPPTPSASAAVSKPRPLPPPDYGGGRPNRDRVAQELARADLTFGSNTAAAALAATQALYRGSPCRLSLSPHRPYPRETFLKLHRTFRGHSSLGGSDSEVSKDSTDTTDSSGATWSDPGAGGMGFGRQQQQQQQYDRGRFDGCESPGSSTTPSTVSSPGSNGPDLPDRRRWVLPSEWREFRTAQHLARLAALASGSRVGDSEGGKGISYTVKLDSKSTSTAKRDIGAPYISNRGGARGESTQLRRHLRDGQPGGSGCVGGGCSGRRGSGGGSGGGGKGGGLLREPTPAFLRRWRATRKKQHAKKQVVRFLLRAPEVSRRSAGEGSGERSGGDQCGASVVAMSPPYGRIFSTGSGDDDCGSGGASAEEAFLVYPGSSLTFPPYSMPYSLEEAVAAAATVRQQQDRAAQLAAHQAARRELLLQHPPLPSYYQQQQESGQKLPCYQFPMRLAGRSLGVEGLPQSPASAGRITPPVWDNDELTYSAPYTPDSMARWTATNYEPRSDDDINVGGQFLQVNPAVSAEPSGWRGPSTPAASSAPPAPPALRCPEFDAQPPDFASTAVSAVSAAATVDVIRPEADTVESVPQNLPRASSAAAAVSSPSIAKWRPPSPLDVLPTSLLMQERATSSYSYDEYGREFEAPPQRGYSSTAGAPRGGHDTPHTLASSSSSPTGPGGGVVRHMTCAPTNLHAVVGPDSNSLNGPSTPPQPITRMPPSPPSLPPSTGSNLPGAHPSTATPPPHAALTTARSYDTPPQHVVRTRDGMLPPPLQRVEYSVSVASDGLPSPPSPSLIPMTGSQLEAAAAFPADPRDSPEDRGSSLGILAEGGPNIGTWAGGRTGSVGGSSISLGSRMGSGSMQVTRSRSAPTATTILGPNLGRIPGGGVAAGLEGPMVSGAGAGAAATAHQLQSLQSLQLLRDQQSTITRDVQLLMNRLADMRGRLEK